MKDERTVVVRESAELTLLSTRRKFLQALGLGGTIVLLPSVFAACDDNNSIVGPTTTAPQTINLSNDIGILQFAHVLEQLEAAYYDQTVGLSNFRTLFNAAEQEMLVDIRNDEVIHREFLRAALGSNAVPNLTFNFGAVTPVDRPTLLKTAFTLETNGVGAYNGAGAAIKSADYLLLAGKIVSVEARHTSAIADAMDTTGTAYADLTNPLALSLGAVPANALDAAVANETTVAKNAQPFITNPITITT